MKVLVVFESSNEYVVQSAKYLAEMLRRGGIEVDSYDARKKQGNIMLASYQMIIVGSVVWRGKVSKHIHSYLLDNKQELINKPMYIYLFSHLSTEEFQNQVSKNLPIEILEHAETVQLGMDVEYKYLGPIDKIVWSISGQKVIKPRNEEELPALVSMILNKLNN